MNSNENKIIYFKLVVNPSVNLITILETLWVRNPNIEV